ncbi:MAG: hypothetical protein K2L52_03560 [Clostridia bacterium]|nr:hypothetical protein [Clostridia bacterium]
MNANGNGKRRFNYRHIICVMITLGCLACSLFRYSSALGRIIEGGRDFGLSIAYYFCEMFGIEHNITPTVNDLPKIPFFDFAQSPAPSTPLPDTTDGFKANWTVYWQLWATKANFMGYLSFLGDVLFYTFCCTITIILPLVGGLYLYLKRYFKKVNNDYNKDSRPLKVCKWLTAHTYSPVKRFVVGLWAFIKEHKQYVIVWGFIWAFNFNIIAIVLEFLAYYFYFVVSFDVASIYRQVYKLFLDLSVPLKAIPVWAWVMIGLGWFDNFRKKIAYATLNHYEMRNRGFVNARPIVFMTCGTMGKKKTTTITDMGLSQEVMFRDKALEKLLENDLKFPYFPWINLENELKRAMQYHEVYNLATVRKFVYKKAKRWQKTKTQSKLFDYEYERYGFTYDDKLKIVNVWEVIENYAQLYFIYIIQSSLIISNYSIRVDAVLSDLGNFPMWNSDFFKRDSRLIDSFSRHSHILDFDSLRLGRKVVKNNINANNFEFGVVVITEVGKERGNNLELQEKKKKDIDTNQKNDLFNSWLKMVRHSATVDNFPFVRVIVDEQRPESWGADARDLCEIVHIREGGDTRLAMPFFSLAELLYDWILGKFSGLYYQYRYVRSDKTVPMYALKAFTAKIDHYYTRIYNRFGYCRLQVQTESGTQDGQRDENKYYLMPKKIYSKRFSTDCYSDYFTEKALRSPVGIDDLREYETEKATFSELRLQNSYFVNDLLNGLTENKK